MAHPAGGDLALLTCANGVEKGRRRTRQLT